MSGSSGISRLNMIEQEHPESSEQRIERLLESVLENQKSLGKRLSQIEQSLGIVDEEQLLQKLEQEGFRPEAVNEVI